MGAEVIVTQLVLPRTRAIREPGSAAKIDGLKIHVVGDTAPPLRRAFHVPLKTAGVMAVVSAVAQQTHLAAEVVIPQRPAILFVKNLRSQPRFFGIGQI